MKDTRRKELVDKILYLKGTTHIPPVSLAQAANKTDSKVICKDGGGGGKQK